MIKQNAKRQRESGSECMRGLREDILDYSRPRGYLYCIRIYVLSCHGITSTASMPSYGCNLPV
jgi:hypothetical protein